MSTMHGHMNIKCVYLYLLCFVSFVLCSLYCFVYAYISLLVLLVLPPSDNLTTVDNNNNNNKAVFCPVGEVQCVRTVAVHLTLSLLMTYIYGAPCKARNFNVIYIRNYVWQR
jgi:hypothetical protein